MLQKSTLKQICVTRHEIKLLQILTNCMEIQMHINVSPHSTNDCSCIDNMKAVSIYRRIVIKSINSMFCSSELYSKISKTM